MENPGTMLLALLTGLFLAAQASPTDLRKELDDLERAYDAAREAYYAPLRAAKTDEERSKVELDPKLEPGALFAERFRELAHKSPGDESCGRALLWLAENGSNSDAKEAVSELVDGYVDSPLMSDLAQFLRYGSYAVGHDRALEVLGKIEKGSPLPAAKAAAVFVSGVLILDESGKTEEAKERFRRVQKEFADTPWAARATAALFEAENLQVGMVAPDFEAIDENGKSWKSSELRGKVVVLDFWGFW